MALLYSNATNHVDNGENGSTSIPNSTNHGELLSIPAQMDDDVSSTLPFEGDDLINWDAVNMWSSSPKSSKDESPRHDSPMADHETGYDADDNDELEDDVELEGFTQTKYELRPQTRDSRRGFTSTWIDQDKTGDFDPSEESRKERLLRNRLKLRSQQLARVTSDGVTEEDVTHEVLPKIRPTLLVKLLFPNEAKAQFQELVNNLPASDEHGSDLSTGYQLRKRNRGVTFTYKHDYDVNRSRFAPDLPDDPTGHPFARGCWQCIALGQECPLLKDETAWPCSTCSEDDNDCELVVSPELKRACERCRRRRQGCSYTYTLNHGVACQQCIEDGHHCIAGPAKDAIATRVRYDRDWTSDPVKKPRKPKHVSSCSECIEAGLSCSLLSGACNNLPCEACKINNEPCTLEHLIPKQRTKTEKQDAKLKQQADDVPSESSPAPKRPAEDPTPASSLPVRRLVADTPPSSPLPLKRPAEDPPPASSPPIKRPKPGKRSDGVQKTIETKLCHPITFNCDSNPSKKHPCHFCAEPGYGILGLGKKKVEVIEWNDGRGLEEISGGHRGNGLEPTRLCCLCTTSRMSIIMCPTHEMRPLLSGKKRAMDLNDALSELLSGTGKKGRDWCAICPSLASYECRAPCEDDIDGCGLKLCEDCVVRLIGSYDGDLQSMLPELKDEPTKGKVLGLRADYGLLKQDGLLMRFMLGG